MITKTIIFITLTTNYRQQIKDHPHCQVHWGQTDCCLVICPVSSPLAAQSFDRRATTTATSWRRATDDACRCISTISVQEGGSWIGGGHRWNFKSIDYKWVGWKLIDHKWIGWKLIDHKWIGWKLIDHKWVGWKLIGLSAGTNQSIGMEC